jgi:hypothetical protein
MTGRKPSGKVPEAIVEVTGWGRKHTNRVLLGLKRRPAGQS